ncbi:MAG: AAA family ATPase [Parachlamydiaceae bacterium]|nr:AAA family ATPase [Parachlamydiaceae bacterium]
MVQPPVGPQASWTQCIFDKTTSIVVFPYKAVKFSLESTVATAQFSWNHGIKQSYDWIVNPILVRPAVWVWKCDAMLPVRAVSYFGISVGVYSGLRKAYQVEWPILRGTFNYLSNKAELITENINLNIITEPIKNCVYENIYDPLAGYVHKGTSELTEQIVLTINEIWNKHMTLKNVAQFGMNTSFNLVKGTWNAGTTLIKEAPWQLWAYLGAYTTVALVSIYGRKFTTEWLEYYYASKKSHIGDPNIDIQFIKASKLSSTTKYLSETRFLRRFFPKNENPIKPIFNDEVQELIDHIVKANNNVTNDPKSYRSFQNVLLSGPPGTGKTMVAEAIAKQAGFNCVLFSGADLQQLIPKKQAVSKYNDILDFIKKQEKPTVVFIDEADVLFPNRKNIPADKIDGIERLELINAILRSIGSSKKVMFVFATNLSESMDPAIKSRTGLKIEVGLPNYESRVKILQMYIKQAFKGEKELETSLHEKSIQLIAEETEYLSGRTLEQLVNHLVHAKWNTDDQCLTEEMVHKAVRQFVLQERGPTIFERAWTWINSHINKVKVAFKDVYYLDILRLSKKLNRYIEQTKVSMRGKVNELKDRSWKVLGYPTTKINPSEILQK